MLLLFFGQFPVVKDIFSSTLAAQTVAKAFAAFAYPAYPLCRHTCHQGIVGYVFGHHGSGGNESAAAYGMAAYHGAVGAQ